MQQNNKKNYRHDHIQKQIMVILNETLHDEIYDNIVKLATFTETRLTSDYSTCTVFVDTYDRKKIDSVIKAVEKAKGVFKTQLAKKMTIRKIPNLNFVKDCSIDRVLKIEKIIQEINKKK
ncbi:30S ribosome-binding factor RbfA [bacterium]|nr:30S ribosome-binding factor RbfA [bacterium]